MRQEIRAAIHTTLDAASALTTALGGASQIIYGWPEAQKLKTLLTATPCLLFWGADITTGGQRNTGDSRSKSEPDSQVSFHIYGYAATSVNGVADALLDLFKESSLTTTNYKVLRISLSSDFVLYEDDEISLIHRILSFTFGNVWHK